MSLEKFKRKHIRAPLKREILYVDEGHLFKANAVNLSESGLLMDQLPHIPTTDDFVFFLDLPQYPVLANRGPNQIEKYVRYFLPRKIHRLRGQAIRKFTGEVQVDEVFMHGLGIRFLKCDPALQKEIGQYVDIYTKNLVYLLKLMDESNSSEEKSKMVTLLASILGYQGDKKRSLLRQEVYHDYQSLLD